jgi:hypothetical protein
VVSELMFAPPQPDALELSIIPDAVASDFQFIELYNGSSHNPISLAGLRLDGDAAFDLTVDELQPGEYAVLVANQDAFTARYGTDRRVLGTWERELSEVSPWVRLLDTDEHLIMEVRVDGDLLWPSLARDGGASLELRDPVGVQLNQTHKPQHWQASVPRGGTPNSARHAVPGVILSEVRAGLDVESGQTDRIELQNRSDEAIDLSGWRLSDAVDSLTKYVIPSDTILSPGQFLLLSGTNLNPTPELPESHHFRLSEFGGKLYLSAPGDEGEPIRLIDTVTYGPMAGIASWGRIAGDGELLSPLTSTSWGEMNSAPRFGPVLITEVAYHPPAPTPHDLAIAADLTQDDLEFIELTNLDSVPRDLGNWQLQGVTEMQLPASIELAAGETLLVVSFDPSDPQSSSKLAAFRQHYGLDESVTIVGGVTTPLNDDFGLLRLVAPVTLPEGVAGLVQSQVRYDDAAPWPSSADGLGHALSRIDGESFGADAASWTAAPPSPGSFAPTTAPQSLLPDLAPWINPLLGLNHLEYFDTHPTTGRLLMRFATAIVNQGAGPLIVQGGEASADTQLVYQIVRNLDGSTTQYAAGEFVFHPEHNHVHFGDYAQYKLRAITPDGGVGDVVAGGDKVSFCLVDFAPYDMTLPGAPTIPVYRECERQTQGISVGWADIYTADLYDQWIDVHDVPPGEYWFETSIDPFDFLLESDETNNVYLTHVVIGAAEYEPDALDAAGVQSQHLGTGDVHLSNMSLHQPGDTDTFRWVAPADGMLHVHLDVAHHVGDADLYVWSSGPGGVVELYESVTDRHHEHLEFPVERGKTYFVVVKDLSGNTTPSYTLNLEGPPMATDAFEPNDSILSPTDLTSGNHSVSGLNLHAAGDQDYFAWTAEHDGVMIVDIQFNSVIANLDLYVHDFHTHHVYRSQTNARVERIQLDVVAGETYLIVVSSPTDQLILEYSLNVNFVEVLPPIDPDALESNDSLEEASALPLGDYLRNDLSLHAPDDVDFFHWTASAAGTAVVDLLFEEELGELDLVLWIDGQEAELAASTLDGVKRLELEVEANEMVILQVRSAYGESHPEYGLQINGPKPPQVAAVRACKAGDTLSSQELDQIPIIPWLDWNRLQLTFTKPVVVTSEHLEMTGTLGGVYPTIDFAYDETLLQATWTFASPVAEDMITVRLSDALTDVLNNPLDGERLTDIVPSGDGVPGGPFELTFRLLPGDFTADGRVDGEDLDQLAIGLQAGDLHYDLDSNGVVDTDDILLMATQILGTVIGDSNLDGRFDSTDLIQIFQAGQFEDGIPGNSRWAAGDWNGDGDFTTSDLVFAFQQGSYQP